MLVVVSETEATYTTPLGRTFSYCEDSDGLYVDREFVGGVDALYGDRLQKFHELKRAFEKYNENRLKYGT